MGSPLPRGGSPDAFADECEWCSPRAPRATPDTDPGCTPTHPFCHGAESVARVLVARGSTGTPPSDRDSRGGTDLTDRVRPRCECLRCELSVRLVVDESRWKGSKSPPDWVSSLRRDRCA